jgi:hypothetical protein
MLVTDQPQEYLFKKHDRLFTQPLAAGNAGWRLQFRYRGLHHQPRVPELWTLIWLNNVKQAIGLRSESFHFPVWLHRELI